jgi:alpha-glucosidase
MARMKAGHKALSAGGMKFLYAENNVVAIARFRGGEAFVGIISTNGEDVKIRLPLGAIGAESPRGTSDIFGKTLEYTMLDEHSIELTVKAHQSYFMECAMR